MASGRLLVRGLERHGRIIVVKKPFPLMGHIGFGVIDRGFNNLQVRVTSACALSCIFCSVNAGPQSPRISEFMVDDPPWLAEWIKYTVRYKGALHLLFDGAGDPLAHPRLVEHVREAHEIEGVLTVAVETRLFGADEKLIDALADAGVVRLNVSIDSLEEEKAKRLAGNPAYSVGRVLELARYAFHEHGIDVHFTPVWIPGVNDRDIEQMVEYIASNPLSRRYPPLGIQKYVAHRRGRRVPGVREWSWEYFFKRLKKLEDKYGIRLVLRPEDFDLKKAPRIPHPYHRGETLKLTVVAVGWLPGEYLGVPAGMDRVVTVVSRRENYSVGDLVIARLFRDDDGILLAKPV